MSELARESQAQRPREASTGRSEGVRSEDLTELYDLRVVVDRIEGRSVCGMTPGDHCDITGSSRLSLPAGGHFCFYALAAVFPLLSGKQRQLAAGDWLATDNEVACPDPGERLIMRIERRGLAAHRTDDLT